MRKFLLTVTILLVGACGGGGGGSSSSASTTTTTTPVFANQVTISANVNANAYPTVYAAVASTPAIDDTCLHNSSSISYPESYKGVFQLPQVDGSFAKTNVALSITPKDDWVNSVIGGSNPNMNTGCLVRLQMV